MKRIEIAVYYLIASVLIFSASSCSDDEPEVEPSPVTITIADMPFEVGVSQSFTDLDSLALAIFASPSGENQSWDFSSMGTTSTFTSAPYQVFADESIPSANFQRNGSILNTITGQRRAAQYIFEHGEDGIFSRSTRLLEDEVVPILEGTGSLTFLKGDQIDSNGGVPLYLAPATYGTSNFENGEEHVSASLANFTVTLPSAGLDNVSANTLDSTTTNLTVTAWGQLQLPGYNEAFDVIVQDAQRTIVRNYLLGGNLAPAGLLAGLGLRQNELTSENVISFITPKHGVIALIYSKNGELQYGYYKNDIPTEDN